MTLKHNWPVIGIAVALGLFVTATMHYPGGTTESATTVGYSWAHNFISSLFAARALNGAVNTARSYAILAMVPLSLSVGAMFWRISTRVSSRVHRKTIEIAGIGSMVYGFLVVTRMHDLMVTIGLLFSLVALLATTHALYLERRWTLFGWGALCIAVSVVAAAMYYGNVFWGALPVMQKAHWVVTIGWILAVHHTLMRQETKPIVLNQAIEPAR